MNYRIGTIAKMLEVSAQSIRNWEAKGVIPYAYRTPTGHRIYADADVANLRKWLKLKSR